MSHDPGRHEEKVAGALEKMPYDVAYSLALLGFRESWRAALVRAEKCSAGGPPRLEGLPAALSAHKKGAKEAREAWEKLGARWAKGPRGEREGAEVVKAIADLAKAAALHCAAARVWPASAPGGKKDVKKQRDETEEHYRSWEAAVAALKEHGDVLAPELRDSLSALLWNSGWHAANAVADMLDEAQEEEEEEEEFDEDCEEDGDDTGGEEEDEDDPDERFGEDYPGSSDDYVDDLRSALEALRECFWEAKPWRGVSLSLVSLDEAGACAELEAIAAVPGLFGELGLNAVRLVVGERAGERDALGPVARGALLRAKQLGLQVVLEVPAAPGKKHEAWLQKAAAAAAEAGCVQGVALPRLAVGATGAAELLSAVRAGGLSAERCAILVPVPGGQAADAEDEWTPEFRLLHECGAGGLADGALPWLLKDANVLLEAAPCYAPVEEGGPEDLQGLLDATAAELQCSYLGVAGGLVLDLPQQVQGAGKKAKPSSKQAQPQAAVEPPVHWYTEYAQRLVAAARQATHGFFFDSWLMREGAGCGVTGLKEYLAQGWVDFSADCRVMHPAGAHKATIVYLHGFSCDADDYLMEPWIFYRPKPPKKGKDKGKKTKNKHDCGDEEEDIEYEPWPGLKVIFPTAPLRKITAHDGQETSSWFDYATDFDGEAEDEIFEDGLEEQARRLHAILDAEAALVGAGNVYVGGASQGGCSALHVALTYPGDLGAVVCTMGHLMKCTPVSPEWVAKKVPVYNYLGDSDTTFPWDKWVKAVWDRFEKAGAEVHHHLEPGLDHCEGEDKWVPAFLKERLTPSSVKKTGAAAKKATKKK